jgi:hypothetical protein
VNYVNLELSEWNIAEAEHRARDRIIRRKLLLAVAAHYEARTKLFAVARLQPALPRSSSVTSIAQDLQQKFVSFGIVGLAIRQVLGSPNKMRELSGDVGLSFV